MASIINAATSGGLISTADTSGILQLQTAGTTAVTVDASQNVGVGTASPAARLDVSTTSAAGVFTTTQTSGNAVTINVDGSSGTPVGLRVAAGFGTIGSTAKLINVVDSAGGNLFNAQASGVIGVGSGVAFPATQVASSNANTLDDYEEGTWTPSLTTTSGSLTTVSVGTGYYTKVGRMVTITCSPTIVTNGTGAGALLIDGLPFPQTANGFAGASRNDGNGNVFGINANTGTQLYIQKYDGTYPGGNGYGFSISISYFV